MCLNKLSETFSSLKVEALQYQFSIIKCRQKMISTWYNAIDMKQWWIINVNYRKPVEIVKTINCVCMNPSCHKAIKCLGIANLLRDIT